MAKLSLAQTLYPSITSSEEELGGQLLWSCHQGWAGLQGYRIVNTALLKLVTPPETPSVLLTPGSTLPFGHPS